VLCGPLLFCGVVLERHFARERIGRMVKALQLYQVCQ
jgi:hypothetical protein